MATIGGDVTEQITNEVNLFGSIIQQNVIENKFNRYYATLATIQQGMAIEFVVKCANNLNLDLNNSRLHVLAKITKQIKQTSTRTHRVWSIWRSTQCFAKLAYSWTVETWASWVSSTPTAHTLKIFSTFAKKIQETRLLCEGWTKDAAGHMGFTAVNANTAGLNDRATTFAKSTVVELIGRPHLDVFNQERIPPNIDLHIKLMPSPNKFACKSGAPGQGAQQRNYKLLIQSENLIVYIKKLTSAPHIALLDLLVHQNMRHHLPRV